MPRLNPIKPEGICKELEEALGLAHTRFEELPNFLKVVANSRAALKAYVQAAEALRAGELTAQHCEQIALAVGEINGCHYSLLAHCRAAEEAGLTGEEICQARAAAALDPKVQAMLEFTQRIVLQRGRIRDEDYRALSQAGFSPGECVEIIANIGLNIFSNYLNLAAKIDPDAWLEARDGGSSRPSGAEEKIAGFVAAPRALDSVLPRG